MSTSDRVRGVLEPLLSERGLEVADVVHSGPTLRVTLERSDGAVLDLDTISEASRLISSALDGVDPVPGRYTLEVSSPGLERTLRTPAQFRRFVGQQVALKTRPGTEGERRVEGALEEVDEDGVVVAGRRLAYAEVERARTVFLWGPSPKPARPKRKKALIT